MVGNAFVLANLHLFYLYTEDFLELKELEFSVVPGSGGLPQDCQLSGHSLCDAWHQEMD